MSNGKLNYFLLALSLSLTVPEGLGEISKVSRWNSNNLKVETANQQNVTNTQAEDTQRSNNGLAYEAFPQYQYYGQQCSYYGGKIVCKNRRDGGTGGGVDYGGGMDSYAAAAGALASYGVPASSYGTPMAMASGGGGWGGETEDDDGGGLGGIGELAGLVGLLGLKGLKGLKGAKGLITLIPLLIPLLLPLFLLLAPILLPLILAPLLAPLLFLILLLFVPIPVFIKGARGFNETLVPTTVLEMATEFLNSDPDHCLERISCEIANMGRTFKVGSFIDRFARSINLDSLYKVKIRKGLTYLGESEGLSGRSCSQLSCNLQKFNRKMKTSK